MISYYKNATRAWHHILRSITENGEPNAPRGLPTKEVPHLTLAFDMVRPVIYSATRKLSYRFMAAEALWIISGDDRLEPLMPFNRAMANFSDDGGKLAGAYGVPFADQYRYVTQTLATDLSSRQATMTLWRPNPAPSKDIPCTVVLDFKIRRDPFDARRALDLHVFMRSSDAWLGVPYDFFSFTMMALRVACIVNLEYGQRADRDGTRPAIEKLGRLYFTAASSHLYAERWAPVEEILATLRTDFEPYRLTNESSPVPAGPMTRSDWLTYAEALIATRDDENHGRRGLPPVWFARTSKPGPQGA